MPYDELNERYLNVLRAVISCYVIDGGPVGSRTIARKFGFALSPATIRNAMADLEEMGYLRQVHTSSGRVPTDKGYRLYVDHLTEIPPLTPRERMDIERSYFEVDVEIEDLLEKTSKTLSSVSKQAGVVFMPGLTDTMFDRFQLIRIGQKRILVILIGKLNYVNNKVIEVDEDIPQEKLDGMTRYLNQEFRGLTLREIRARVIERLAKEKEQYDKLMTKAMELGQRALPPENDEGEVFVGGVSNVLNFQEFIKDVEKVKRVFRTIEEKAVLINILDKCIREGGINILIGSENSSQEMGDVSLVLHPYNYSGNLSGVLGVLGPKRMEYPRIMAIVHHTAVTLERVLTS